MGTICSLSSLLNPTNSRLAGSSKAFAKSKSVSQATLAIGSNKVSKLASDYTTALEKLVEAYGQISDVLPRFDRLGVAFRNHHDFQQVLGVVYSDIIAFHEIAYKFFRRPGKSIAR
jgi:hypothetical protein